MFHWYGLIVGIAAVVWWSIAERLEPKLKKIVPIMLLLALVGARSYHVFEYWQYYQGNVKEMFSLWAGGLSIWGALILGGGVLQKDWSQS
jgi:phosphatidylglycerol:prolipoprotein diacylglycerol transferase